MNRESSQFEKLFAIIAISPKFSSEFSRFIKTLEIIFASMSFIMFGIVVIKTIYVTKETQLSTEELRELVADNVVVAARKHCSTK